MALNAAKINRFTDEMSRHYARMLGVAGSSSYGVGVQAGTDRAADAITDLQAYLASLGDADLQVALSGAVASAATKTDAAKVSASILRPTYLGLLSAIRALGLSAKTLDAYLSYLNYGVGGTNSALANPYFRALHYQLANAYPTNRNLFFEIKSTTVFDGVTYSNGLRKHVVGTGNTAGTAVPNDGGGTPVYYYAGGVPYVSVTNFAGSSDTVTVTGTEYNPATGAFTPGKTWTATVNANGDFALASGGGTPASANALIVAVSLIAAGANITASTTIIAQAHAPTSRVTVPF